MISNPDVFKLYITMFRLAKLHVTFCSYISHWTAGHFGRTVVAKMVIVIISPYTEITVVFERMQSNILNEQKKHV